MIFQVFVSKFVKQWLDNWLVDCPKFYIPPISKICLRKNEKYPPPQCETQICTTALPSHTLQNTTMRSKTAMECQYALNCLSTNRTVKLYWVAGHEGHAGNEKADTLAKKGTTSDNITTGYVPQTYIKKSINSKVQEIDMDVWANKGTRHTKCALNENINHIRDWSLT